MSFSHLDDQLGKALITFLESEEKRFTFEHDFCLFSRSRLHEKPLLNTIVVCHSDLKSYVDAQKLVGSLQDIRERNNCKALAL